MWLSKFVDDTNMRASDADNRNLNGYKRVYTGIYEYIWIRKCKIVLLCTDIQ